MLLWPQFVYNDGLEQSIRVPDICIQYMDTAIWTLLSFLLFSFSAQYLLLNNMWDNNTLSPTVVLAAHSSGLDPLNGLYCSCFRTRSRNFCWIKKLNPAIESIAKFLAELGLDDVSESHLQIEQMDEGELHVNGWQLSLCYQKESSPSSKMTTMTLYQYAVLYVHTLAVCFAANACECECECECECVSVVLYCALHGLDDRAHTRTRTSALRQIQWILLILLTEQ